MKTGLTPLPATSDAALKRAVKGVEFVECSVADFSSIPRGKRVGCSDFLSMTGCKMPSVVLGMGLTGGESPDIGGRILPANYADLHLQPDLSTGALLPPALQAQSEGAAPAKRATTSGVVSVICEPTGTWFAPAYQRDIDACELSPRAALRAVLARLDAAGYQAVVAPELELFLLERHEVDGHIRLRAPCPTPGNPARESACEAYSLERSSQFAAYFDALFAACAAQHIPVCGYAHEAAYSQYEVNFMPGEPLAQADAVWRFKRLAREQASRMGFLASFIPKPFVDQPGTGMHWHVSLYHKVALERHTNAHHTNAFSTPDGGDTEVLHAFLGGLQRYSDAAMAFFAPSDMAFERIRLASASPESASWGLDDRAVAFRIPQSSAAHRRIENRLPGGDANPYLVLAAMLGLGLAGLAQGLRSSPGGAGVALPTTLAQALDALAACATLRDCLGDPLVDMFVALKRHESAERNACADPRAQWDLVHLLELA